MSAISDPAELLRRLLIADAARLIVAIFTMTIGLASVLVQCSQDPGSGTLWFGLLALLYGYRAAHDRITLCSGPLTLC